MEGDMLYGMFECRRSNRSIVLDIQGGRWGPTEVRGKDEIVVGRPGRLLLNRVYDVLIVNLIGWVVGLGTTPEERWEDFNATLTEFETTFDLTTVRQLKLSGPYTGLNIGEEATLDARTINIAFSPIMSAPMVRVDIELECVSNPPAWAIGFGG